MSLQSSAAVDDFDKFSERVKKCQRILLCAEGVGVEVPITRRTAQSFKEWLSDEAVIHYLYDEKNKKITITQIL